MRCLFISHVSGKYGAARSLLALVNGLQDKGVTAKVILPRNGPLIDDFNQRQVAYTILPLKQWASRDIWIGKRVLRGCFNLLLSAFVAAKATIWNADVIYTNSSVIPVGAIAALLARKPHIWHIREFGREDYGLSFDLGFKQSAELIGRLSSQVIVISEALRSKYAQHICSEKLQVVYNPVGLDAEAGFSINDARNEPNTFSSEFPVAAIVGMIHPAKGQMDAVLAVAELVRQGVEVNLKIVGDGVADYLSQLKQVVFENHIGQYIEFTGFVNDPLSVMQAADMVLVCSQSEAFGRVTIESMFSSTPVIGSRSGATPELVKEGFNGLLYEPGNHKELAERIQYLIAHSEEAQQMGRNGYEWALERFTVERYTDEIFALLKTVIQAEQEEAECTVQH